jgi:hypothetical protein
MRQTPKGLLRTIEVFAFILLASAIFFGLVQIWDCFASLSSDIALRRAEFMQRYAGTASWYFWLSLGLSIILPQLFWIQRIRQQPRKVLIISLGAISPSFIFGIFFTIITMRAYSH